MPVEKSKPQLNQSLIDGVTTLQELALSKEPVGCRELARRLHMDPTRVNRLLMTLEHLGIARKTQKRKYTTGPGMHVLAAQSLFASGLINHAIEPLETLRKYGLTVALGMLWRDHVSYLYHALPGMNSTEAIGRLGLYPASSGGVGLALLASLTNEQVIDTYQYSDEIPAYPNGVDDLLEVVEKTRQQGYSYVQTTEKDHTLAITVGQPAFCAIGISGWLPDSIVSELLPALLEVAEQIKEGIK
ncbi:IclR family transcriptional regulator [Thalassotalea sp. PLHSN55]|uniref:IclR family transcriptional regulator n=1 Tax=Thalassotalea sp. PLHSN55 TaxID=3435888 RepID=UPI003F873918